MTDSEFRDDQFEAFLDGQLDAEESRVWEERLKNDPDKNVQAELTNAIDQSLKATFSFSMPASLVRQITSAPQIATTSSIPLFKRRWVQLSAAAVLLVIASAVVFRYWHNGNMLDPTFKGRPLTEIYLETKSRGFKPYYLCDEPVRFAQVFDTRHGVSLKLNQLPVDRTMTGVSYLGGLSRSTTAILCRVEGQPVIVFVDNEDQICELIHDPRNPQLKIHQAQKFGLVFFEVSPLDDAKIIPFLDSTLQPQ